MITGIDLVKLQIKVAQVKKIPFKQEDLKIHATRLKCGCTQKIRLITSFPDIGTLQTYKTPAGQRIRVDDGFEQGMEIPFTTTWWSRNLSAMRKREKWR